MSVRRRFHRTGLPGALLTATATALALASAATTPVRAEIITVADMARGISITAEQCSALPSAVWVTVTGRQFCVRYYISTAGGQGDRPVVFLQGDKLGFLNLRNGTFSPPADAKDVNTDDLVKAADSISKQYKTTGIYLARIGVDGSSGHHNIRNTILELNATNAALEAIKARHRLEGFHFIGQSGGGSLVGGMLGLRADIGCAVIGSGRLARLKPGRGAADATLLFYDPSDDIAAIARNRSTRILVLTDPADKRVPERNQTAFVEKLRGAGGQVEQFMVEATDEHRHNVIPYARLAASGCIRGAETQKIAEDIRQLVERRVATARKAAPDPKAGKPGVEPASRSLKKPAAINTATP